MRVRGMYGVWVEVGDPLLISGSLCAPCDSRGHHRLAIGVEPRKRLERRDGLRREDVLVLALEIAANLEPPAAH